MFPIFSVRISSLDLRSGSIRFAIFACFYMSSLPLFSPGSIASSLYFDTDRQEYIDPLRLATTKVARESNINLWVSSYSGTVTTLSFNVHHPTGPYDSSIKYSLTKVSSTTDCILDPSWLTLDPETRTLYCVGEGLRTPYGGLTTFDILDDGVLHTTSQQRTLGGGVSGALFQTSTLSNIDDNVSGSYHTGFAIAHYSPGAISTFIHVSDDNKPSPAYSYNFTLAHPGPVKDRQDAAHPHQVIVDPTGRYLLSPDLGADLVRVFALEDGGSLRPCKNMLVDAGSGPRHGIFSTKASKSSSSHGDPDTHHFYLVHELQAFVTDFIYHYPRDDDDCLELLNNDSEPNFGREAVPNGTLPAEIQIQGDNSLIASNRFDSSFLPSNTTNTRSCSDSLSTFTLHPLSFHALSPAGGRNPRHFSISPSGEFVLVALQDESKVVIIERDVATGSLGEVVAEAEVEGEVTCAIWDE